MVLDMPQGHHLRNSTEGVPEGVPSRVSLCSGIRCKSVECQQLEVLPDYFQDK